MVTHYNTPKLKIRIDPSGDDDEVQTVTTNLEVVKPLNAIDAASFIVADYDGVYYNNTIVYGDEVAIYLNFYDEDGVITASHLRFYGFVEDLNPQISPLGATLKVDCRGYGRCMLDMVVNQEYGSQSKNPTIDELHEILQDNGVGIVDNYVEEIMNLGDASGYTVSDTYIEPDTDVIKYIYFPFKPVKNCLDDLQTVFQALQTHTTAGWHWIFQTEESPADTFTHRLLLTQVANHSVAAPDINAKWPTWWNTDQANSTLVERVDFMSSSFTYQRPQANYVVYSADLRKPGDGDRWTETTAGWDDNGASCVIALDNDAGDFKVGANALNIDYGADGGFARYPDGLAESWEIDDWGGQYNIPTLSFWIKSDHVFNIINLLFYVRLYTDWAAPSDVFSWTLSDITVADTWYHYNLPIGPNAPTVGWLGTQGWTITNNPDWHDINFLSFSVTDSAATGCILHIDGLNFNGHIIRAAKKMKTGGAAEDYYKQKLITDAIAKDDSGVLADDSYVMGQMAYGELLRVSRRPLTGTVQVPMLPTIEAGQLAHIHASPHSGGYRVNKDMRVLRHRISVTPNGAVSYLTLTDDLINGLPLRPPSLFNAVLQASNPEFQNRQISSLKTRGIDITQTVMETEYQFNDYY